MRCYVASWWLVACSYVFRAMWPVHVGCTMAMHGGQRASEMTNEHCACASVSLSKHCSANVRNECVQLSLVLQHSALLLIVTHWIGSLNG